MPGAEEPLRALAPGLVALAEASPGLEICGLAVGRDGGPAEAWPLPNRAVDPRRSFALGPEDLLGALRRLEAEGRVLLAVFHSHPTGGAGLSARDLDGALAGDEPLLPGVAQVVVAMEGGLARTVREHRWVRGRFRGRDLWTSVQKPGGRAP